MTDIYQGSGSGATSVLPPPQWIAEPPPWAPSWTPPTQPGGAGGGYGSGPYGPQPAWQPPPSEPRKTRGRSSLAIVIVAALVSALIGVAIGSRLARSSTTPVATATTPSLTPSSGGTIPSGGGFNPSFGTTPTTPIAPSSGGVSAAAAAAIAAKVTPGIVDINTQLGYQQAAAAGTGMVLTASGEVLTNNHVIDGSTSISVTIPSTGRTYSATVVGDDPTQDVAVIQLKGASGLKTIPTGDSSNVAAGDSVVALGNAGGVGGAPSVVTGSVQALNQTITASDEGGGNQETLNGLIETNAPIQPGDSGGPLVNGNSQVIGMDTAASSSVRRYNGGTSTTASFAIPINTALSVAQQIESGKATSTIQIGLPGFLGVSISETYAGSGAEVVGAASGTPADRAGLGDGDVITAVDGTAITSGPSLTTAMQGRHAGQKVTLTWTTASGSSQTASLTLASGPAN